MQHRHARTRHHEPLLFLTVRANAIHGRDFSKWKQCAWHVNRKEHTPAEPQRDFSFFCGTGERPPFNDAAYCIIFSEEMILPTVQDQSLLFLTEIRCSLDGMPQSIRDNRIAPLVCTQRFVQLAVKAAHHGVTSCGHFSFRRNVEPLRSSGRVDFGFQVPKCSYGVEGILPHQCSVLCKKRCPTIK